jgi:hypothetical protein
MDCKTYRALHTKFNKFPLSLASGKYQEWAEHHDKCINCQDWVQAKQVEERGYSLSNFPCVHIAYHVTQKCEQHPDPYECPDVILIHDEKFDEYGIPIKDGGNSFIKIDYCPWCGIKLPKSKRDLWFKTLESLGYKDPFFENNIPPEFETNQWYKKKIY